MKKVQYFKNAHLSIDGMRKLDAWLTGPGGIFEKPHLKWFSMVLPDGAQWEFDVAEQFLGEYRPGLSAIYTRGCCSGGVELEIINNAGGENFDSRVLVRATDKPTIQAISEFVEGLPAIFFSMPSKKSRACRRPATANTHPRRAARTAGKRTWNAVCPRKT